MNAIDARDVSLTYADGEIVASGSPAELESRVGGEVLDVELADPDPERPARAREVAGDSGLLDDGSITATDDGLGVTAADARRFGTDLLVALDGAGFTLTGFNVRGPTRDDVSLAIAGDRSGEDGADDGQTPAGTGPSPGPGTSGGAGTGDETGTDDTSAGVTRRAANRRSAGRPPATTSSGTLG